MSGSRLAKPKKANRINRFGNRYYLNGFMRLMIEVNKSDKKKIKRCPK